MMRIKGCTGEEMQNLHTLETPAGFSMHLTSEHLSRHIRAGGDLPHIRIPFFFFFFTIVELTLKGGLYLWM